VSFFSKGRKGIVTLGVGGCAPLVLVLEFVACCERADGLELKPLPAAGVMGVAKLGERVPPVPSTISTSRSSV
jgi:hypothetical protein